MCKSLTFKDDIVTIVYAKKAVANMKFVSREDCYRKIKMNVDFRKKVQWTTPDVTQCIASFNTVDDYAISRMV